MLRSHLHVKARPVLKSHVRQLSTVRAPVFTRHQFFGTSEHYGKAHGSLLSGWMNYNYTACCWFPTSSNILILPSQFCQIRFESCWLHCSKCRILVLLRYEIEWDVAISRSSYGVYVAVTGSIWLLWGYVTGFVAKIALPFPCETDISCGSYGVYMAVTGSIWLLRGYVPLFTRKSPCIAIVRQIYLVAVTGSTWLLRGYMSRSLRENRLALPLWDGYTSLYVKVWPWHKSHIMTWLMRWDLHTNTLIYHFPIPCTIAHKCHLETFVVVSQLLRRFVTFSRINWWNSIL